jgi:hypothetical protein
MKQGRSQGMVRVRRDLAQLLRQLRAIKRMKLSPDVMAGRFSAALAEAGHLGSLVSVRVVASAGSWQPVGNPRIDKRRLREAELGQAQAGTCPFAQHAAIG